MENPPLPQNPTPSRYQWSYQGVDFDFYRLCDILGVTHHAHAHALKKVIRAGRSVKPLVQDIDEAISALQRWREMVYEDEQWENKPQKQKTPVDFKDLPFGRSFYCEDCALVLQQPQLIEHLALVHLVPEDRMTVPTIPTGNIDYTNFGVSLWKMSFRGADRDHPFQMWDKEPNYSPS